MPKKATARKTSAKKTARKTTSKVPAKKVAAKKAAKSASGSVAPAKKAAVSSKNDPAIKSAIRSRGKKSGDNHPGQSAEEAARFRLTKVAAFTLEDALEVLKVQKKQRETHKASKKPEVEPKVVAVEDEDDFEDDDGGFDFAPSLDDILGVASFDEPDEEAERKKVPRKFLKYYDMLVSMRHQVRDTLEFHQDTYGKSSEEDDSDGGSYSQHQADEGTDTYDRDFALNVASADHEMLKEVEDAIQRIFNGTYGICEVTGEVIPEARLKAVPHTRYSLEGRQIMEKTQTRKVNRGGVFEDTSVEDTSQYMDEDSE